ncbi:LPS export ABC transporter periplasmic protein LptC [Parvularcula lutaonensis]|uniref:LPS export ABC transporter periplasmic protein LptC n=1 Tax=Parvularcula lutaonensis TaxID=491923 RepID=A0ABV7MA76_9PROT|nr:LPS export ABC transporter periplasmic protein LptC [Parvularcula lutaonensis]GGY45344.1 hypothetical protein GCM10007148_12890 [Parvularcula lutaonensis]
MAEELSQRNQQPALSDVAARVSRHTAVVRHLRLAVPALAVGLIITYALSATPPQVDREFIDQFAAIEETEDGVKLAKPRYAGEDLEGQPFEIAANSATRSGDNDERVGLELPEARRVRPDGQATLVRARDGLYDQTAKRVDLSNDVELEQQGASGSFILRTDAATMDIENQVVSSETEVTGEGKGGKVRADRGTLYQGEDRIVLEGGVKITLEPAEDDGEEDASNAETDGS